MSSAINKPLLDRTRSQSKKLHAELAKGEVKTGKEQVRESHYKNASVVESKRNQLLQKFVSEGGRGGLTSIVG